MSALIEDIEVMCPYCGESMEVDVDCTSGSQSYYEDCQVCCAPVRFDITVDAQGDLTELAVRREDE
jgi:hypothetical protein